MPGLDGLRAVAVAAVVLFHAGAGWMSGGFLGVDVFLVISGYLITLLLLGEHDQRGAISWRRFWSRRARRLLPALFALLIAVTTLLAVFARDELAELRGQLAAAVTYCTNWFLIFRHQSYFDSIGRPPVLQHLWSLAVEEQFYLLWPVLLVGLLRPARRRVSLATVIGVGAVASAAWMAFLYQPGLDPSRVYYGTDTRAAALLLGALLAVVWRPAEHARLASTQRAALDVIGATAVAALVVAFVELDETNPSLYRGGFFIVAVLAMVAVVAAAHAGTFLGCRLLGNRPLTWIGKRSYSIYLWHWPIVVFTRPGIDIPLGTYPTLVLRIILTLLAAEASYRYVETPIRDGRVQRWLADARGPASPLRRERRRAVMLGGTVGAVVLGLVGVSVASATQPLDIVQRSLIDAQPATAEPTVPSTSVAPPTTAAVAAVETTAPASTTTPLPKTLTVVTDSVLLGAQKALVDELGAAGWAVDYRGHPAMMIKEAVKRLTSAGAPVGTVAVVGLGYNSLWEKNRAHFASWAAEFDKEADDLVATLSALGAHEIVWVTLREATADITPKLGRSQLGLYAWYFPYVNERLRALTARHPGLVLADWAAVSGRAGLTYDAIHLNPDGIRLMIDTIRTAAGI
jgi:peptidoglycan/LPS O-acetylase OafA/YrhL